MRKLLLLVLVASSVGAPLKAQTRILIGADGGSSFGNLYLSSCAAVEAPIRRMELDAKDCFSPLEQHISLGSGWANRASSEGIVWASNRIGFTGGASYSNYHVNISKSAWYANGGLVFRSVVSQIPMRFTFEYIRQLHDGISKDGTESAHLQAGRFNMDMRMKCAGKACYRLAFDFEVGRVLTQSNPICDGTYGTTGGPGGGPCPRTAASAGAFSASIMAEFPRRKSTEHLPF